MTVKTVYTYLSPKEVIEGHYAFDGLTVTMMGMDDDGTWLPLAPMDEIVSEPATPETVIAVAKRLTKKVHLMLNAGTENGFRKGQRLDYPVEGVA